jgi:predicted Zn-dependent protease
MLYTPNLRKVRRWPLALLASLCLPATLAMAQLPTLGDGSAMSVAVERQLGEKIARELYRDPDYIDDPVLSDYVQGIWRPLLAAARLRGDVSPELDERFQWEVLLGKDRTINAFALPGGFMGLHLGLVASVANRDELASVLAHELSHVTQRHISRMITQQDRQTPLLIGAMVLAAIAASKNPDAANAVVAGGQALAMQGQLNFSRDMEREADRIGFGLMGQAGFEPCRLCHHVREAATGFAPERQWRLPLPAHPPADDRAHGRYAVACATPGAGACAQHPCAPCCTP